jgi:hypothetical protein
LEIRSIEVWSAAKVLGTTYALIGLIIGILSTLGALASDTGVGAGAMTAGGVFSTIIIIIVYAIAGFLAGVLTAVFYNVVASIVGGIRITTR